MAKRTAEHLRLTCEEVLRAAVLRYFKQRDDLRKEAEFIEWLALESGLSCPDLAERQPEVLRGT